MSADMILGINPGTRFIGIAVMNKRRLMRYEVKSFNGIWTHEKLQRIMAFFERVIRRESITAVVVKIPDVLPASLGFTQVVGSINALCEHNGIRPKYRTFSEIKAKHCREKKPTTSHLMTAIVSKHPELSLLHQREQRNKEAYYYKAFEAVAVAHMA